MTKCSITNNLEIVPGSLGEYAELGRFHYRENKLGPYAAIFAIKDRHSVRSRFTGAVGVIVYSMPSPGLELRGTATGGFFNNLGRRTALQLINENIRCISRVIIEPRYRGLGLAARLVAETMPKMNVPIIEAMAVMGRINPFFEKAGMKKYTGNTSKHCVQFIEALSVVGIEGTELIEPVKVQKKLDSLPVKKANFIEQQIRIFLQRYGKRRTMPAGIQRTRFVLGKLNFRPAYYIWFNPEKNLSTFNGGQNQNETNDKSN